MPHGGPRLGRLYLEAHPGGLRPLHALHQYDAQSDKARPRQKGATILIGGKAPILKGANLSWVLIPFMEIKPPYTEIKDLLAKIWDWWDEHGRTRERLAELIQRIGLKEFLKAVDLPPVPQMVSKPRSNPYVFF